VFFSQLLKKHRLLSDSITIVGSGPQGLTAISNLNGIICGVNQAVELPSECHYWFISDCSLASAPWFRQNCLRKELVRIFHQGLGNYTDYTFLPDEDCEKATVLGACLKTFVLLGAKRIQLCGFDLKGTGNYNGPTTRPAGNLEKKAEKCSRLMARFHEEYNVEFKSLTPTTLVIP